MILFNGKITYFKLGIKNHVKNLNQLNFVKHIKPLNYSLDSPNAKTNTPLMKQRNFTLSCKKNVT